MTGQRLPPTGTDCRMHGWHVGTGQECGMRPQRRVSVAAVVGDAAALALRIAACGQCMLVGGAYWYRKQIKAREA